MPVPKRKRSRARRDSRFANKGVEVKAITECSNCKTPLSTHSACKNCGFYKGKKIMTTKIDRAIKRGHERQSKVASAQQREKSMSAAQASEKSETKE